MAVEAIAAYEPLDRGMIDGEQVVCVSIMDWDWPFWTSRQHLMSEFARKNQVLFVDPPLTFARDYLRLPSDERSRRKLVSWARDGGITRRSDNLWVWSPPPAIPFNRVRNRAAFSRLLSINQRLFLAGLKGAMKRLGFDSPILWVSFNVYYGAGVVAKLGERLSVYHCTDEISGFPGYASSIVDLEADLVAKSDLVITSSEVLRNSKAAHNPNSHFIPNGADVGLFRQATTWNGACPADLAKLPSPRAGFIGQVEYRFDFDLVRDTARLLPNWSFALVGPVQEENRELEKLRGVPNIHFLGLKQPAELPAYLANMDVTLIPYKIDRLTRGIYPLKLHEYLAAEKPVVATPLPSLLPMGGLVSLAQDPTRFAEAIEQAVREDTPERRAARWDVARLQGWEGRATEISTLMRTAIQRKETMREWAMNGRRSGGLAAVETEEIGGRSARPGILDYLRTGRELAHRHSGTAKRLAYSLLGDLNAHRRIRTSHALRKLKQWGLTSGDILDAGCGEGASTFAIATQLPDCRVLGVDVDPGSVATCERVKSSVGLDRVSFERADLVRLTHEGVFDAAVCVDVLEHVRKDEDALRGIFRALKPGGLLIAHVPKRHQQQRRFLPTHHRHHVEDHVRDEYTEEEITGRVGRAGFQLVSSETTFGPWGEISFEVNTLLGHVPVLRYMALAATFPLALLFGYMEAAIGPKSSGNSFLLVARKPIPGDEVSKSQ